MAWKAMDVQDQRVRFVVAASRREKPLVALCAEFGISRPTGSLWIKRYAKAGLAGIAERSRRAGGPGLQFWAGGRPRLYSQTTTAGAPRLAFETWVSMSK